MKIAYIAGEDQDQDAQAHVRALLRREHEAILIAPDDDLPDDFDLVVGRDVPLADALRVGRIVDEEFYRARPAAEHEPLRVLLAGPSQLEAAGIEEGYGAVAHARWFHQKLDLIRASPWAPSREEPLDSVQEFHVGLDIPETARLLHTCDAVISPRRSGDFGFAAARAMAAGVPAVVTAVAAHRGFDDDGDYALFAPPDNAVELGERLIELLGQQELRSHLRERGRSIAERWRAASVIESLEAFLMEKAAARQR